MGVDEHVLRNRQAWDRMAEAYREPGRRAWARDDPVWGIWQVPDPPGLIGDVTGRDILEAGCGTAYWSAWLARRGASTVGLDNSPRQLATARELVEEHGEPFPLVLGDAERLPFRDECFDLVLSEYGASIWCDPHRWIPEAARVLRPGGELVFLRWATLLALCMPDIGSATESLVRAQFGLHRLEWSDDNSVEFHLPHGELIALLRHAGFQIEALIELQAPEGAPTTYDFVTPEWARRWPSEEIWKARKR